MSASAGHPLVAPERLAARAAEPAGTWRPSASVGHGPLEHGGVGYAPPTVRGPHVAACALADRCPGRVYVHHERRFGLGELAPVPAA